MPRARWVLPVPSVLRALLVRVVRRARQVLKALPGTLDHKARPAPLVLKAYRASRAPQARKDLPACKAPSARKASPVFKARREPACQSPRSRC